MREKAIDILKTESATSPVLSKTIDILTHDKDNDSDEILATILVQMHKHCNFLEEQILGISRRFPNKEETYEFSERDVFMNDTICQK